MRKLRMIVHNHEWLISLNDSETANRLWQNLPVTAAANRWGEEIYFRVDIDGASGTLQEVVAKGDVAFCPPETLCVFFGPTPLSEGEEIRPASPVIVVGRVGDNLAILKTVAEHDSVRVERAE